MLKLRKVFSDFAKSAGRFVTAAVFVPVIFGFVSCGDDPASEEEDFYTLQMKIYYDETNGEGDDSITNESWYWQTIGLDSPVVTEKFLEKLNGLFDLYGLTKSDGIQGWYTDESRTQLLGPGELSEDEDMSEKNDHVYVIYTKVKENVQEKETMICLNDKNGLYQYDSYDYCLFPKNVTREDILEYVSGYSENVLSVLVDKNEFTEGNVQGKIIDVFFGETWEEMGRYFYNITYRSSLTDGEYEMAVWPESPKTTMTVREIILSRDNEADVKQWSVEHYDKESGTWIAYDSLDEVIPAYTELKVYSDRLYVNLCAKYDTSYYYVDYMNLSSAKLTAEDLSRIKAAITDYGFTLSSGEKYYLKKEVETDDGTDFEYVEIHADYVIPSEFYEDACPEILVDVEKDENSGDCWPYTQICFIDSNSSNVFHWGSEILHNPVTQKEINDLKTEKEFNIYNTNGEQVCIFQPDDFYTDPACTKRLTSSDKVHGKTIYGKLDESFENLGIYFYRFYRVKGDEDGCVSFDYTEEGYPVYSDDLFSETPDELILFENSVSLSELISRFGEVNGTGYYFYLSKPASQDELNLPMEISENLPYGHDYWIYPVAGTE